MPLFFRQIFVFFGQAFVFASGVEQSADSGLYSVHGL